MKKNKHTALTGLCFLLPSLIGISIFILIPFADVLRRSFTETVSGRFTGITNYTRVLHNSAFSLASKNTARFIGICIPLLLLLTLFTAVILQENERFGQWMKTLYLLPMAIPVAAVALLWKLIFHSKGFLSSFLHTIGKTPQDWMNTDYSFWILIFTYIWKNFGYVIVLWMAGLAGIPGEIYEAARVDGAGRFKCFIYITLPNLKPIIHTITILSLLNAFKVFREGYLVAGDYPHKSMYLLQHLFNNWFREMELDKMAAAAVITAAVILVLILILEMGQRDNKR